MSTRAMAKASRGPSTPSLAAPSPNSSRGFGEMGMEMPRVRAPNLACSNLALSSVSRGVKGDPLLELGLGDELAYILALGSSLDLER